MPDSKHSLPPEWRGRTRVVGIIALTVIAGTALVAGGFNAVTGPEAIGIAAGACGGIVAIVQGKVGGSTVLPLLAGGAGALAAWGAGL